MNLKINAVHNHGTVDREYVSMTVVDDTNLKYYMVADCTYDAEGKRSNLFRHVKWLPDVDVKAGERVSLRSRVGKYEKVLIDGVTWHRVYWGSKAPIWNDDEDAAILFRLRNWKTTRAK